MEFSTEEHNYSELHIIQDKSIDFYAAICLHRHGRGAAIGGCRFINYSSSNAAVEDAIRLSHAMSYKAIISELPHDGGKAVIRKPQQLKNRELILNRFAEFVESLKGKYVTTVDSGTNSSDMAIIKRSTSFVTGFLESELNNPANSTALGVFEGIKAAVKIKLERESLDGLHVAIQGVGSVGYRLANLLHQAGVKLTICDVNSDLAQQCKNEFKATVVDPSSIYSVKCDVFSPCALGRIINSDTINKITAPIIAGAANDQLSSEIFVDELSNHNIYYVPDYLINAGGLIHLALEMQNKNQMDIEKEVTRIGSRITNLSNQASMQNKTLYRVTKETVQNKSMNL